MSKPSDSAATLLLGTGLGCFLISGFGLLQGRMHLDSLSIGWFFPVTGVVLLLLSRTLRSGSGPLSRTFPDENDEMLSERVRGEIETTVKDASVGSAWAELEAAVLESELSDEEE